MATELLSSGPFDHLCVLQDTQETFTRLSLPPAPQAASGRVPALPEAGGPDLARAAPPPGPAPQHSPGDSGSPPAWAQPPSSMPGCPPASGTQSARPSLAARHWVPPASRVQGRGPADPALKGCSLKYLEMCSRFV